ncbi:MAG TPA: lysylphosphatidylglycerol synthase domain-containing protein, partial [Flavobacterium sp.]|nr:lysylphosphatidylglycerol synthase domain-containing protein [Flavobacterium sp.]
MENNTSAVGQKLSFSKQKLFFYLIAIIILAFVTYYFSEIKGDIKLFAKVTSGFLLVAIFAQGCVHFFTAVLYHKLLSAFHKNNSVRLRELFEASIVSFFVNQTIPSGGVSGNVFFFHFLRRNGVSEHHALSLIFSQLVTLYCAIISSILVLLVVVLFLWKGTADIFIPVLLAGIAIYGFMAFVIGSLGKGKRVIFLLKILSRVPFLKKNLQKYELTSLEEIVHPSRIFTEHTQATTWAVLLQFCVFLSDSATIFALFAGLNVHVPFIAVFTGL